MICDWNVYQRCLGTEVSAHVDDVDFDLLLRHTEVLGHLVAQSPRPFVGGPDLHPAVRMNLYGTGMGLQITMMRQRGAEGMFENASGAAKSKVEIAVLPL